METANNYERITKGITIFDACTSGQSEIPRSDPTEKYGKVLSKLIDADIKQIYDGIDDYITDTFHTFAPK